MENNVAVESIEAPDAIVVIVISLNKRTAMKLGKRFWKPEPINVESQSVLIRLRGYCFWHTNAGPLCAKTNVCNVAGRISDLKKRTKLYGCGLRFSTMTKIRQKQFSDRTAKMVLQKNTHAIIWRNYSMQQKSYQIWESSWVPIQLQHRCNKMHITYAKQWRQSQQHCLVLDNNVFLISASCFCVSAQWGSICDP